jgi:hypothetical protein
LQYYIGCSGWSYSAWQGPFYPANIDNSSDWLLYYASVFDYVEIDSSQLRIGLKKLLRISGSQPNSQKLLHMTNA